MRRTLIGVIFLFAALTTAQASAIEVSIDTRGLVGQGTFYAQFEFTSPNRNNVVTLSQFSFNPGLARTLPLQPGLFFSEVSIPFIPGPALTFQVDLQTNPLVVRFPDELAFRLLDDRQKALPSSDPLGLDALLTIVLQAEGPAVATFAGVGDLLLSEPVVGTLPPPATVPEPGSLCLLGLGLLGSWLVRGRQRRRCVSRKTASGTAASRSQKRWLPWRK